MSCEAQCVLSLTTKKQPTAQVEAWSSQLVHTTETLGPRGDRGRRSAAVSQTAVTDRILNKEQRAAGNALLGQLGGPLPGLRLPGPATSPGGTQAVRADDDEVPAAGDRFPHSRAVPAASLQI